ncbi:Integrin alpha-PS2 [Taenia solium]|eukprot:TsM_000904400 transcript=TsM_000904400 gene=TsM_000904400
MAEFENEENLQADFAVGAPYDEGGGAVIIYHGSNARQISVPTQVSLNFVLPNMPSRLQAVF